DGGGRLDLDPEVVEGSALAGVLEEDELERRVLHREVRVAGALLGRLDAEQLRVERGRLRHVVDVKRQLDAGHVDLRASGRYIDLRRCDDSGRNIDHCQYVSRVR